MRVRGPQLLRGLPDECEDSRSPAQVLGPHHPLARALDLREVLLRQSTVTGVVLALSATAVLLRADWAGPVLVAGALVQLVLGVLLMAAVMLSRDRARDLLIEGCDVGLPVLARERRRLLALRRREALAASLEDLVRSAERWGRTPNPSRPVYEGFIVRQVAPELLAVAADLRAATVGVCGVARVERLLTTGTSPLYGPMSDELRAELALIAAGLAGRQTPP